MPVLRLFLTCYILIFAAPALAQNRHALVIGIDTYTHIRPLERARNDARAVGGALEAAGFKSQTVLDPDRRTFLTEFSNFTQRLRPGDEALFYFAGHGVEVAGRNVLLAADVPALREGQEALIDTEGLPVDRVLAEIQKRGARDGQVC